MMKFFYYYYLFYFILRMSPNVLYCLMTVVQKKSMNILIIQASVKEEKMRVSLDWREKGQGLEPPEPPPLHIPVVEYLCSKNV